MSLIHEALKRTEQDKQRLSETQSVNPPRSSANESPGNPRQKLVLLTVAGIVGLCLVGNILLNRQLGTPLPSRATAAEPVSSIATPIPVDPPSEPKPAGTAAEQSVAKTLDAVKYYQSPAENNRGVKTQAQAPTNTKPNIEASHVTPVVANTVKSLLRKSAKVTNLPGKPASDKPSPKPAPTKATESPATKAAGYSPEVDSLKLSAIMRGPAGATAIINGKFVRAGSRIGQARVLKVKQHAVEMELANGRIHTIYLSASR